MYDAHKDSAAAQQSTSAVASQITISPSIPALPRVYNPTGTSWALEKRQ
jgi:hypothetical protein